MPMTVALTAALRRRIRSEPPWSPPGASAAPTDVRCCRAHGQDGEVRFFLQRTCGGLYVELDEIPKVGVRTCQSFLFASRTEFARWCEEEPSRFAHPLEHALLKRDGDALWQHSS
jgi:hypothetical protein